jgi:hypothetical protein
MRSRLKKTLSVIAIVMIVCLVAAGILVGVYITKGVSGLLRLPGMTAILGLDHAKDLGMGTVTQADRDSLIGKLGGDPANWPSSAATDPRTNLAVALTPKEAVAFLESAKGATVLSNTQIELLSDGYVSLSAMVKIDGVLAVANMKRADIEGQVGALPEEVPVYVEFKPVPGDGTFGIILRQLKIGSVTIPGSSLGVDAAQLDPYIRDFFEQFYGVTLNSLSTDGASILLDMDAPLGG